MKKIYVLTSIAIVAIGVIAVMLGFNNFKKENNDLDDYDRLKKSIENLLLNESYKLVSTKIIDTKSKDNLDVKQKVEISLSSCENSKKIELVVGNNNSNSYLGGIFVNTERIEIITPKDESIFTRYKDIFSILSRSIPTLREAISDFEKINYKKYFNLLREETRILIKSINLDKYNQILKDILSERISYIGIEELNIDNENILTSKYEIKITEKEKNKLINDMLIEFKNDENLKTSITNFLTRIIDEIEKDKEYAKIRFTSEEFQNIKTKVLNYVNDYEKYIDQLVLKVNEESNIKDENENIIISYNLDNDLNVVKVNNNDEYTDETGNIDITNTIVISKINKLSKDEVSPKVTTRINLAEKDRVGIFAAFVIVKDQFKKVIAEAYNIWLNDIIV